jgi:squalene monooxygenase
MAVITLARQGRRVRLVERSLREPDRIVGELLQPGGVAVLKLPVLGECINGIESVPVRGYKIFYVGQPAHPITFLYPQTHPLHLVKSSGSTHGQKGAVSTMVNCEQLQKVAKKEPNINLVEKIVAPRK